ncbi:MAG: hypothetical protein KC466_09600 [Myxococcales bacterium]|nr:hypothetical protein [Myxococcales bacterium]
MLQPAPDPVQTLPATAAAPSPLTPEGLLAIFLDTEPTARSPYGLYGYPPMWPVATRGAETLFARPGRTMTRVNFQYLEVEGVHWQAQRDGRWIDQGRSAPTEPFLNWLADWRATPVPA